MKQKKVKDIVDVKALNEQLAKTLPNIYDIGEYKPTSFVSKNFTITKQRITTTTCQFDIFPDSNYKINFLELLSVLKVNDNKFGLIGYEYDYAEKNKFYHLYDGISTSLSIRKHANLMMKRMMKGNEKIKLCDVGAHCRMCYYVRKCAKCKKNGCRTCSEHRHSKSCKCRSDRCSLPFMFKNSIQLLFLNENKKLDGNKKLDMYTNFRLCNNGKILIFGLKSMENILQMMTVLTNFLKYYGEIVKNMLEYNGEVVEMKKHIFDDETIRKKFKFNCINTKSKILDRNGEQPIIDINKLYEKLSDSKFDDIFKLQTKVNQIKIIFSYDEKNPINFSNIIKYGSSGFDKDEEIEDKEKNDETNALFTELEKQRTLKEEDEEGEEKSNKSGGSDKRKLNKRKIKTMKARMKFNKKHSSKKHDDIKIILYTDGSVTFVSMNNFKQIGYTERLFKDIIAKFIKKIVVTK